jgi:mannose-6-phosphate isomerase-like protein (cupin superfamily)
MESDLEIYQEERPWGYFRRFTNNIVSTVKILSLNPNEELSLQSHSKRKEFWRVIKGDGFFEIDGEKFAVGKDDEKVLAVGAKHRIKAGENGMEVLEISLGEYDENDIIRYEDKYGRV